MQDHEAPPAATRPQPVRHRRSLPLYVGSGGVATASHYAVTIAAVELLSVPPIPASAIGFTTGAAIKYWLNYSVAFQSRARHRHAMVRYAAALAAMLALNTLIFGLLQARLGVEYILAQAITTALLIPPGYVLFREWVFR
ncbi:MAG TPA: GtrA family protein [Usitatibacter sp.]|nr:GtrA family protein [Usitatibacter sp.]HXS51546.1 GtrA family protein [Usitatibacter sp.]